MMKKSSKQHGATKQTEAKRLACKVFGYRKSNSLLKGIRKILDRPCKTQQEFTAAMESVAQYFIQAEHGLVLFAYLMGRLLNEAKANKEVKHGELEEYGRKLTKRSKAQIGFYRKFARAWDAAGKKIDELCKYPSLNQAAKAVGVQQRKDKKNNSPENVDDADDTDTGKAADMAIPSKRTDMYGKVLAKFIDHVIDAWVAKGKRSKERWLRTFEAINEEVKEVLPQLQRGASSKK